MNKHTNVSHFTAIDDADLDLVTGGATNYAGITALQASVMGPAQRFGAAMPHDIMPAAEHSDASGYAQTGAGHFGDAHNSALSSAMYGQVPSTDVHEAAVGSYSSGGAADHSGAIGAATGGYAGGSDHATAVSSATGYGDVAHDAVHDAVSYAQTGALPDASHMSAYEGIIGGMLHVDPNAAPTASTSSTATATGAPPGSWCGTPDQMNEHPVAAPVESHDDGGGSHHHCH